MHEVKFQPLLQSYCLQASVHRHQITKNSVDNIYALPPIYFNTKCINKIYLLMDLLMAVSNYNSTVMIKWPHYRNVTSALRQFYFELTALKKYSKLNFAKNF